MILDRREREKEGESKATGSRGAFSLKKQRKKRRGARKKTRRLVFFFNGRGERRKNSEERTNKTARCALVCRSRKPFLPFNSNRDARVKRLRAFCRQKESNEGELEKARSKKEKDGLREKKERGVGRGKQRKKTMRMQRENETIFAIFSRAPIAPLPSQ